MKTIQIPTGSTSNKWFNEGYQSAMQDIVRELTRGGEEAVRVWLKNNTVRSNSVVAVLSTEDDPFGPPFDEAEYDKEEW
jgi:hypothetical protein